MQSIRSRVYRQEIKAAVKKICEEASSDELRNLVCNCCHMLQKDDEQKVTDKKA